ncbi:MAG: hypothetical protein EPN74_08530 [Rhodanobacter sp.]|nr:MAG: hypothetical protein EPN74_08530 [Rhodanobacter sp.]
MKPEVVKVGSTGKTHTLEVKVQPQSVNAIELRFAAPKKKSAADSPAVVAAPHDFANKDEVLLDQLQSAAFRYFTENVNPDNGLVADNTKAGSAASISATGFALSCYPVAVERGWLSRKQAVGLTLKSLRFFANSRQGSDARATGHKGFYYHFLDMNSGARAQACELSTIDTAMLLAGMVVASVYFDRGSTGEKEIRSLVKDLLDRVDWTWTVDENGEINQSWKPGEGFKKADWEGYTEALVMYVLGTASRSHPMPPAAYRRDAEGYQWHRNAGLDWIHATPLFIHLFPQAWVDMRGLHDGYVSKYADIDYFENTRRAITVQRDYADLNPNNYAGYSRDIWGLSACEGPVGELTMRNGEKKQFQGYAARGVTAGPDDGTLVPWAPVSCIAHSPAEAMVGVRAMLEKYPRALRDGQFVGAINPSLPGDGPEGWIAPGCFGIDQGLVVMMIENARSGLIWELTRNSAVFKRGLKQLGFAGGWLS